MVTIYVAYTQQINPAGVTPVLTRAQIWAALERKVRLVPDLRDVWSYINPYMLFGRHMGYRGNFEKDLAAREAKAVELFNEMEEVKNEAAAFMKVRAVWQFFETEPDGEALHLFTPGGKEPLHTWKFKRQKTGDQLCLADYVLQPKDGKRDHIAVFVVTAGEIDLSFPATMGFSAWIFALVVQLGFGPYLGIAAGLATGLALGWIVGSTIVYFNLSSLVATLGMNFMLRGIIQIINEGKSIALVSLTQSPARQIFSGIVYGVPTQMFWAAAFVIFATLLYNRHRFGAQVKIIGDNPDSATQMGINVARVRISTFVFMGLGAALAGVLSTMVNFTWWPTTGDGYLLPAIASVFVGGTPTWGGVGTVTGAAIGALTVSFIQSGIVSAGLSGFYVQFFNGLIIVLALLGHRWNQKRYR